MVRVRITLIMMNNFHFYVFATIAFNLPFANAQQADCIVRAAECFQVNPLLIKAIIWNESKNKAGAVNVNKNKTIDVGIMQINTVHFNQLKTFGINEQQLQKDRCINVFAGTWVLKQNIIKYGYTWDGVGSYHSRTDVHKNKYIHRIISLIAHHATTLNKIKIKANPSVEKLFSCNS